MNTLHILTISQGKFLLVGSESDAKLFAANYKINHLDSVELNRGNSVNVKWLAENDIIKVISL